MSEAGHEGAQAPRPPGRPRDLEIDRRILSAARTIYARRGWTGFNFEGVAREALVSKDAVYRRFESPLDLLIASWADIEGEHDRHERALDPAADIRTYLLAVAMDHFDMYTRIEGFDYLRLYVEAKHNPRQLNLFHDDRSRINVSRVRAVVRAAMTSGVLPDLASPTALLDAVVGGVAMHVMVTPLHLRHKMLAGAPDYLTRLVDIALRGAGYGYPANASSKSESLNSDIPSHLE